MRQIILLTLLVFSTAAISTEQADLNKNRLQLVMLDLLTDSQSLTEGIFKEDFKLIASSAEKIANHPNPGAEILQEIKKDLAADMPKFKMHDAKVHNAATSIVKLAGQHDLVGIFAEYHKLIDGCQSCHSDFRGRISVVLGKK